ncbi:MAG: PKD domain-containing protein, partial [Verrucomicrobia bacterium]|nr:PKD domain-containing protein [Verrucomicrobiota bacterium]
AQQICPFASAENNGLWAVFDPSDPLDFDLSGLVFEQRMFTDVTAVGFIINQPNFLGSRFWMQWNGFSANFALNSTPNRTPVATLTRTPTGILTAPATVLFDSAGSVDPDGEITFIRWESGDGSSTSGPIYEHTYQTAGRFVANLTVWDNNLVTASMSEQLFVASPATTRPQRTVASWGGNTVNSNVNFRDGGNVIQTVDISGDGNPDARRRGTPFRVDSPLLNARGTTLYGGIWNTTPSEGAVESNQWNEGGIGNNGVNDRFTIRLQPNSTRPAALHGAIFIDKSDFLGDAAELPVRFAEGDRLIIEAIDLFERVSPLRWMVRNGTQFYVSEATITSGQSIFTVPTDSNHGRWAEFDPVANANSLNFDAASAEFSNQNFHGHNGIRYNH